MPKKKNEVLLQMPQKAWDEISGTIEADLESGSIDDAVKRDLRRARNAVKQLDGGSVVIEPQARRARIISLGEGREPYVIGHGRAEELDDKPLGERFEEYRKKHRKIETCEDFENFLHWLTVKYDYFPIFVTDAPAEFQLS